MTQARNMGLFELVCAALPAGYDSKRLKTQARAEWWEQNPKLALAWALRKCQDIDWEAYVANSPDVIKRGLEPAWHFLHHGVFAGKKLSLRKNAELSPAAPAISVIVYAHNAALYLQKSVKSVLEQTFQGFEIIIVDDASGDDTRQIALRLAETDGRVSLLALPCHQGAHMARKVGVGKARGKFCMFLDSGCYYHPRALAIAHAGISKGKDIFSFDAALLQPPAIWSGFAPPGSGHSTLSKKFSRLSCQYVARVLASRPTTSVYSADLCRKAFAAMKDSDIGCMAELYEAVVLDSFAKKRGAVKDKLVMCRNMVSLQTGACVWESALPAIRAHMELHGGGDFYPALRALILSIMAADLLKKKLDGREFTERFNVLANQCGIYDLLEFLAENYGSE